SLNSFSMASLRALAVAAAVLMPAALSATSRASFWKTARWRWISSGSFIVPIASMWVRSPSNTPSLTIGLHLRQYHPEAIHAAQGGFHLHLQRGEIVLLKTLGHRVAPGALGILPVFQAGLQ